MFWRLLVNQRKEIKMAGGKEFPRGMSVRDLLKTPQAFRQNLPSSQVDFRDDAGCSQFDNHYQSNSEQLVFYKAKYQELQQDLDVLLEEKRKLQLELISEKSNAEHYQRTVEAEIERIKAEHRTEMFAAKSEADNWKKTVENITAEVNILQENLTLTAKAKAVDSKKVAELQNYKADAEKHKRNIQIYVRRHQASLTDLKRKIDQLKRAELQLEDILNAQKKQIAVFNIVVPALDRQKTIDNAKIFELEREILQLRECIAQQQQRVCDIVTKGLASESILNKLAQENQRSLQNIDHLSTIVGDDANSVINVLTRTCEGVLKEVKEVNASAKEDYMELL
ncbi:unnamed protein product [Allacma fusca]|uniref:Uncharacterized protein n=1 Tax=Allacma fusca TaxID=39272 RepID=A0A8J2JT59_9HEXA|nr:unnamed protein product [Allacma fusca]